MKIYFKNKYLTLLIVSAFAVGCSDESEKDMSHNKPSTPPPAVEKKEPPKPKVHSSDEYKEEKVNLGLKPEDIKQLLFQETYPMGTPYKKLHEELHLKGVKPEGGSDESAAQGLTESNTKVTLIGSQADLKLHFKNDSLIGYNYTLSEQDFNKAEKLYKGLKQFYVGKIGACKEPVAEEETRTTKTCIWEGKSPTGTINYDINTGVINWGFNK